MEERNNRPEGKTRVIIAITGASGSILGIRALEMLNELGIETHLVISSSGSQTIEIETKYKVDEVKHLANFFYDPHDIAAPIASGSFITQGMLVLPCSIKTLSAIANSYASNLIVRSADVTLKEGRPCLLAVREMPFHHGHLRLMRLAVESGAIIAPPIPSFYSNSSSISELIDNILGRYLLRIGINNPYYHPWG